MLLLRAWSNALIDADGCVSVPTVKHPRYRGEDLTGEKTMADARFAPQPFKGWYWAGAVGVLLFMLVGVAGYLVTVMTPIEQVPADQRALMEAMPAWQTPVYAIAVWSGLAGAVGLLLCRRWSVPVLLLSLLAAVGTFLPFALVPSVRELAREGDAVAAVVVIALCWTSFWFARHSAQRGWLK
jgi:hypothetical protein